MLVPTPYAVKCALIDAAYRTEGESAGRGLFALLKEAATAILPPPFLAVTNTFMRAQRRVREYGADDDAAADDEVPPEGGPFGSTLIYREVCSFGGPFEIGLGFRGHAPPAVRDVLWAINYLGRRGGFVQVTSVEHRTEPHPISVIVDPKGWKPSVLVAGDLVAPLDDLGPGATVDRIAPFSEEQARWNRDRIVHFRVLPLRHERSSHHFSLYRRVGDKT
ncbi:MAG: hypothetical protein KIT14_11290 [bacterium]|nr:hypothetical protein [bacterium]